MLVHSAVWLQGYMRLDNCWSTIVHRPNILRLSCNHPQVQNNFKKLQTKTTLIQWTICITGNKNLMLRSSSADCSGSRVFSSQPMQECTRLGWPYCTPAVWYEHTVSALRNTTAVLQFHQASSSSHSLFQNDTKISRWTKINVYTEVTVLHWDY